MLRFLYQEAYYTLRKYFFGLLLYCRCCHVLEFPFWCKHLEIMYFTSRIMIHEQSIDRLTAAWLLPVVAPIVAAGTGGTLCLVIPEDSAALPCTLVASYILWGIGVPFALSILVLYIYRLTVYKVFPWNKYQLKLASSLRSQYQYIPAYWTAWSRRGWNYSTWCSSQKYQLHLALVCHCVAWNRCFRRSDIVGICNFMDCIRGGYRCRTMSKNQVLDGMVGIYLPTRYDNCIIFWLEVHFHRVPHSWVRSCRSLFSMSLLLWRQFVWFYSGY